MPDTLKPCKCGCYKLWTTQFNVLFGKYMVECPACGCTTQKHFTYRGAVKEWNRRVGEGEKDG